MNALMKKGLRREIGHFPFLFWWNECPDEEGIKTHSRTNLGTRIDGMNALMKKGLRPGGKNQFSGDIGWNECPDEEGIKTCSFPVPFPFFWLRWNECPDEEGIKTLLFSQEILNIQDDGMNALMKKGLRPNCLKYHPSHDGMNALMKKGLRPIRQTKPVRHHDGMNDLMKKGLRHLRRGA